MPHTHLDLGWLQTEQGYYSQTVKGMFNTAIDYMLNNSRARLSYSDMGFMYMWMKDEPNKISDLKKVIDSGQFHIMHGAFVLNDYATVTLDDMVSNFQYGRKLLLDNKIMLPGSLWSIDQFGIGKAVNAIGRKLGYTEHVTSRLSTEIKGELIKNSDMQIYFQSRNAYDRAYGCTLLHLW